MRRCGWRGGRLAYAAESDVAGRGRRANILHKNKLSKLIIIDCLWCCVWDTGTETCWLCWVSFNMALNGVIEYWAEWTKFDSKKGGEWSVRHPFPLGAFRVRLTCPSHPSHRVCEYAMLPLSGCCISLVWNLVAKFRLSSPNVFQGKLEKFAQRFWGHLLPLRWTQHVAICSALYLQTRDEKVPLIDGIPSFLSLGRCLKTC